MSCNKCDKYLLIIGRVDPLSVLVLTTRVASPLLRSPSNTCNTIKYLNVLDVEMLWGTVSNLLDEKRSPLPPYRCDSSSLPRHQCSYGCGDGGAVEAPRGIW